MNKIKSGVIATYITYFIQVFISLCISPIIIDRLGQSLYGVYEIALAVSSYIGILSFGIPHSFLRFSALERERLKSNRTDCLNFTYFSTIFILSVLALIIGFLVSRFGALLFSAKLSNDELSLCKNAIILLSVNSSIGIISSALETYILSFERYAANKIIVCCKSVLSSGLSVTALFLGYSLSGVIITTIIVSALGLMFMIIYCYKHLDLRLEYDKNDKYPVAVLFSYSFPIFINLISDQVNWSIDRALLGALSGTVSTAIYGIGAKLHNMYMQVMIAISGVFVAKIYAICAENSSDTNDKLNDMFIYVGRLQFTLAGLVIIGFSLFGKLFIEMWVGPDYSDSYYIGLILIVFSTHLYIQNIATEIQRAQNLHKFRAIVYIAMSIINFALSIVLIKVCGGIGAAIGTAASLVIGDGVIINIYYQRANKLNVILFWKRIIKLAIGAAPSAILGFILVKATKPATFFKAIPEIVIFIILYFVSLFAFGIEANERQSIICKIRRFFKEPDDYE